jgi:predicted  nucleic acid-binding Zn-ribbon protein
MRLPPMLFQKLMRGDAFEQCPSCNRILYYEPPDDAREGGAS